MSCRELVDDLCCFISFSLNANQIRKTSFGGMMLLSPLTVHDITSSRFDNERIRASYVHDIFLKKCKNYDNK
jgi:hypothetical protein